MTGLELAARQAAKGDGQAFEAVCQALQDDVWRYCYALGGDQGLASEASYDGGRYLSWVDLNRLMAVSQDD